MFTKDVSGADDADFILVISQKELQNDFKRMPVR